MSTPFTRISPETAAESGSSRMTARQSALLPQPLSPTMAITSPGRSEKLTSRTACTSPRGER